ncbi:hypothetical protein D3248_03105 [Leucobacter zeae]|nr:hypothetical protein [Leucobacter zeae]
MHRTGAPEARGARRSALPWLLIAVASILLGLLGAHAFTSAEPAGHPSAALSAATATVHAAHGVEASADSAADDVARGEASVHATQPGPSGETLSGAGHLDIAAVCMLALLFTVAVLLRALPVRGARTFARIPLVLRPAPGGLVDPAPPSLLRLGISRT